MDNVTSNHKQQPQELLTNREKQILELLAKGYTVKEVSGRLFISYETVKKHIKNAYRKLGTNSKIEALRKAGLF